LIDEIQFNETLAGMLGKLQLIGTTLTQVDVATNRGEYDQSTTLLLNAEDALKKLQGFDGIIVVGLMKEKAKILRRELLEKVEDAWSGIIKVEARKESVTIRRHFESMTSPKPVKLGSAKGNFSLVHNRRIGDRSSCTRQVQSS
jgi:hypothetical protein